MAQAKLNPKLSLFLYTILIPFIFVYLAHTLRGLGVPLDLTQVITQVSLIVIMIPYFLHKKEYLKVPPNIVLLFLSVLLVELTIYFLLSASLGCIVLLGIPLIPILRVVGIILLAPILEEMYFRGMLQDCINELSPTTTSYTPFISAGLFALGHVRYSGSYVIFLIALIGFVSSILVAKFKNLYPSIFFHAIYNGTCMFLRMTKVV